MGKIIAAVDALVARIKKLLEPSPERLMEIKNKRKRMVLIVMANYARHNRDMPIMSPSLIYPRLTISFKDMLVILEELVNDRLIQRIDGGDKKKTAAQVDYVINDDGCHIASFGFA